MRQPSKRQRFKFGFVLAALIMLLDIGLLWRFVYDTHERNLVVAATSDLGSDSVPSSKKPTTQEVNSYSVATTLPKYLLIPSQHVKARVQSLSIGASNQLQAPNNIYDTGWYNKSALPGQSGATFIDGHVSSWTANGVFYNLKELKPGDTIQIARGDNKTLTYVVNKLHVYDAAHVDMQQVLSPIIKGQSGLNLMTCAGTVIKDTSEFTERLVVYATLRS